MSSGSAGRKICPRCDEDFTDWPNGDDEGVWSQDGLNYCSGECVILAWRSARDEHYCTELANPFGGYDCACGEPYLTYGCASGKPDTRRE